MARAYFTLAGLFTDTQFDNGQEVKLDLQSIKVDGVEQLTGDYFTEVIPAFVNPHTTNLWSYGNCTQSGTYPNPTSIASCTTGIPNSFNPFKETWQVNYSNVVDGEHRGEIVDTISGNTYGLEQFKFGFDNIETPVNDQPSGGSSGASVKGAFYLEYDDTLDFEMIIRVTTKDSSNVISKDEIHTYTHTAVNCSFAYEVEGLGYEPVQEQYFGQTNIVAAHGPFVDAGNGFAYAAPARSGYIWKLELVNENLTTIGTFPAGGAIQYTYGFLSPVDNKIYFMSYDSGGSPIDILEFDPATETYSTWGTFGAGEKLVAGVMMPNGVIYGSVVGNGKFLKIDTVGKSITILTNGATNGGGPCLYEPVSDMIYIIPEGGATTEFYKINPNTDAITIHPEPLLTGTMSRYGTINSEGIIYVNDPSFPAPGKVFKIDTQSGDTASVITMPSGVGTQVFDFFLMPDENTYFHDIATTSLYKIESETDGIQSVFSISDNNSYVDFTVVGNDVYSIPANEANEEILKITFEDQGSRVNSATAFLSGGLSGWITTTCGQALTATNDPIVTQSLGILTADPTTTTDKVFDPDFIKACCYFSPVLAHPTDVDSYKNDVNGFLFQSVTNSAGNPLNTITLTLLKNGGVANGGTDIPLVDNTYGTYYNYGSIPGHPAKKGYQIRWQDVLNVEGEGTYQLQVDISLFASSTTQVSVPFKLRTYTNERAKGTVRIESVMNGYLRNEAIDYRGIKSKVSKGFDVDGWVDQIRFRGFFGNNQPEYEQEQIIFTNRVSEQLRSELINNYVLQTMNLPSCITEPILKYHNLANYLRITDYNVVNHRDDYVDFRVVFDGVNDIAYNSVSNTAVLNLKYRDYRQDYQKSNC